MRIQVNNIDKTETFLINLPKKIDKELSKTNILFMERLRDGAKSRAPVDTGGLKESIRLLPVKSGKNIKKWKLVVGSPHALFQEEGFAPHSFYGGETLNSSKLSPGKTYLVSKWTPFVKPTLDNELKTFNNKINSAMGRAIK